MSDESNLSKYFRLMDKPYLKRNWSVEIGHSKGVVFAAAHSGDDHLTVGFPEALSNAIVNYTLVELRKLAQKAEQERN